MPVDHRQRGRVCVTTGEVHSEGLPESLQGSARCGRKRPFRTDALGVSIQGDRRVSGGVGRDLHQRDAAGQVSLQLEEEGRVQRAGLVTGGVEGGDDQVATGDALVVEGVTVLVLQREGRHGHELPGQLAEAEVELVVAGIDSAGNQTAVVDAEKNRFHLA